MKALINTCVMADILQKRDSFYPAVMEILLAVSNKNGRIKAEESDS